MSVSIYLVTIFDVSIIISLPLIFCYIVLLNNIVYREYFKIKLRFIFSAFNSIPKIILIIIFLRLFFAICTKNFPELGYDQPLIMHMVDIIHAQDVDPRHNNNLQVVYIKLARLLYVSGNTDPNNGLTMNSNNLVDLSFTDRDRLTMQNKITEVHPNYAFRFNAYHSKGFSFSNKITTEILGLFKPT